MIKIYQVIEGNEDWIVAGVTEAGSVFAEGNVFVRFEFTCEVIKTGFNTAAEAQELANELNEENQ